MNIFVTDKCPIESAKLLDSKRVVKMILESAQMLSTAIWEHGGIGFYRVTHKNHPCTIWTRKTRSNYNWLVQHFIALGDEYTKRYGKVHKSLGYLEAIKKGALLVPEGPLTPFANCTTYKHIEDTQLAYQLFMCDKWENDKRTPSWQIKC